MAHSPQRGPSRTLGTALLVLGVLGCVSEVRPVDPSFDSSGRVPGDASNGDTTPNSSDVGDDACIDAPLPVDQPRRLNSTELDTIARDVFGVEAGAFAQVGDDYGVRVGSALGTSEAFLEDYFDAAESLANTWAEQANPTSACALQDPACARQILGPLARRLWRRPVSDDALDALVSLTTTASDLGLPFVEGLTAGVT
ncbi:MAG: DUF1595 domain-containing protein, partial [Myxococcota bacterium]